MSSAQEAVLSRCKAFWAALNAKEYALLHTFVNASGHAALRRNGTEIINITIPELIGMAEKIVAEEYAGKNFEETFEEPEVRVDEDLAMVWVKCRLLVDGECVGKGTNVLCWHRMEGGEWRLSGLADRLVMVP
jgi:hypothetical protein